MGKAKKKRDSFHILCKALLTAPAVGSAFALVQTYSVILKNHSAGIEAITQFEKTIMQF